MGRAPCCQKNGLKKGPWTSEEDYKLTQYIEEHGPGNWRTLPKLAGLERCGKSCRLRWTNYLRPDIKRGRFSFEEEETIIQLHSVLGNKWSAIAARLPGRTDNEIKNYWNTHIRKRLLRMGLDPVTHTPKLDQLIGSSSQLNILSNLLLALNQKQQQQQLLNPQLLSIIASLLNPLGQPIPQNQVVLGNNNISEQPQYQTSWQQQLNVDQSNSIIDNNPSLLFQPHNYSSSSLMSQQQPQLNIAVQPNDDGGEKGFLSAEMGGCGFEVASSDHDQQMTQGLLEQTTYPAGLLRHYQQFSFNSISSTSLSTSLSSSPLNSSFTNNGLNHDDCTSFFNFEIPEGLFDMSELL